MPSEAPIEKVLDEGLTAELPLSSLEWMPVFLRWRDGSGGKGVLSWLSGLIGRDKGEEEAV